MGRPRNKTHNTLHQLHTHAQQLTSKAHHFTTNTLKNITSIPLPDIKSLPHHISKSASIIPSQLHTAHRAARNLAISLAHKSPFPTPSDQYIYGALDLLLFIAGLSVTTRLFNNGLLRYRTADHIPRALQRGGTLHGVVMAVRDGDNLRIRHTPFLTRLFSRPVAAGKNATAAETIHVRLAGVDAPECASFGRPGQTFGPVARDWLANFTKGRRVVVWMHGLDQYRRIVATVYCKHDNFLLRCLRIGKRNVSLELVRAGMAVVYKGSGAQYGREGLRKAYLAAEQKARDGSIGLWRGDGMLPAEYKKAVREGALVKGIGDALAASTKGGKKGNAQLIGNPENKSSAVGVLLRLVADSYDFLKRFR